MIPVPVRRRLLGGLATIALAGAAAAEDLSGVLALVPEDAIAWAVAPSLSRFNADLGDLIDRAGRPELAVAGRPVDVLVSQFGVAAGFDERGSLAIWSPTTDDLLDGAGVVAVPVESAERFLSANLVPVPEAGPTAGRLTDGTVLHHRIADRHVLLAARADLLPEGPGVTIDGLVGAFGSDAVDVMKRSDLVLRIEGAAVARMQATARARAEEGGAEDWDLPFAAEGPGAISGLDPLEVAARFERAMGGAVDIAVAVDADALALGIRGWTRYGASSEIAGLVDDATAVARPVLSALPEGPYYLAAGIDLASFGGVEGWRRMASVLGEDIVDPAALAFLEEVSGVAFAARPSKLGVAMGGVLNDASLVFLASDPEAVRAAMGSSLAAMSGIDGAIERSVSFERDVEQRRGGTADEITMTAEVADESDREPGSRVGDASIQLTAERMMFGPRGWKGLGRVVDGGYAVTFSRRPDVMSATVDAVRGIRAVGPEGRGLASDPTLVAMREWLPNRPGMEMFLDVGRLFALARQVASLVPGADGMIPEVSDAMPPIGLAMGVEAVDDEARLGWGVVVPSEVVGAAIGVGLREAMAEFGANDS